MWSHHQSRLIIIAFTLIHVVNLMDVTYYEILGVSKQASQQEIRQAYKKLAIKLHPDKNPGSEEQEKFMKVIEAYETLKDPQKRLQYDIDPSNMNKHEDSYQRTYNHLLYNGLYHNDPYVVSVAGAEGFEDFMQGGFHFVKFYSPFCPPCQKSSDAWKKVAEVFKGIVRVGAVNCVQHSSFCYNNLNLNGYPSFIFYPKGKHGSFRYYPFERTFKAFEEFLMKYVKDKTNFDIVSSSASVDHDAGPIAYFVPSIGIDDHALTRIAFHLNGLVGVAMVDDGTLWQTLTEDDYVTVVYKYKQTTKYIYSDVESIILDELVTALPEIKAITPEDVKAIRSELRNGRKKPLVVFFTNKTSVDRLPLHQMKRTHRLMQFSEIDCSKYPELCASLQVEEAPAWGVFKPGGAYQIVLGDPKIYVPIAARANKLHSLSPADLDNILAQNSGMWVLLVVPYKNTWDLTAMQLNKASMHFPDKDSISFGIMACTEATQKHCSAIAKQPAIIVQNGARRHSPTERAINEHTIVDFVHLLRETADIELTEQQVMEVLSDGSRPFTWLVAFMPAECTQLCDALMGQWRLVARKLRPLKSVRVSALQCELPASGLCANVRAPTARLYPRASSQYYTASLEQLSQAPYIWEWALEFIDTSIQKLTWHTFRIWRYVVANEEKPKSGEKPWLVYFHSPKCYHCYEKYADFAIAGVLLNNTANLGRVNCLTDRGLCQEEKILRYPTLRMYMGPNNHRSSSSMDLPLKDYQSMVHEIRPQIKKYEASLVVESAKRRDEF